MKFSIGVDSDEEHDPAVNVSLFNTSHMPDERQAVIIETQHPVTINLPIKYLVWIIEATPLSTSVQLTLCADYPMQVEYVINGYGYISYYLAPLILY